MDPKNQVVAAVANAIFRDDGRIDEAAGEKAATTIEKL